MENRHVSILHCVLLKNWERGGGAVGAEESLMILVRQLTQISSHRSKAVVARIEPYIRSKRGKSRVRQLSVLTGQIFVERLY